MAFATSRTVSLLAIISVMAACQAPGPYPLPPLGNGEREQSQLVESTVATPEAAAEDGARSSSVSAPGTTGTGSGVAASARSTTPAVPDSIDLTPDTMASAPQRERDRTGRWEFSLSGVGSNDEDFEVGSGQLNASVGYYLTDALQLGVRQNLGFFDPGPGADFWDGASRLALDFHFGHAVVVPFVGVNAGWVYGDSVDETAAAGAQGGVKIYAQDNAFIQATMEYLFLFDENDVVGEALEDGQFFYTLGIGMRF